MNISKIDLCVDMGARTIIEFYILLKTFIKQFKSLPSEIERSGLKLLCRQ
jgi:hypothetical protein